MSNSRNKKKGSAEPDDGSTAFKGAGSHIQHSIEELIAILVATAVKIADANEGREELSKLMNSAFMAKFARPMKHLERKLSDLEVEYAYTLKSLQEAREILTVTPENLPASKVNHGRDENEHEETEFAFWQMRHKFEAILILGFLPIALGSSAYTAWANLVGTGLPVFIENPVLPISMALLAPMASFSFKTIWHNLQTDWARRIFTRSLNWTAVILILVWSVLFADQFHGLGSGPVAGGLFDQPSFWDKIKETGFTAVTLLTEMCIGTVLAHRLDKIASRYSPDYSVQNPDWVSLQHRIMELQRVAEFQREAIQNLVGEQASYPHSLDLQVSMALLSYNARRSKVEEEIL